MEWYIAASLYESQSYSNNFYGYGADPSSFFFFAICAFFAMIMVVLAVLVHRDFGPAANGGWSLDAKALVGAAFGFLILGCLPFLVIPVFS